ncbi:MAG: hypothetical protein M1828_007627 [Chrysothrix sp. TS-e1954]|nr:MAG: hypothetical protein M1828_007627 [Chrysothrix sp. TS-e1954]
MEDFNALHDLDQMADVAEATTTAAEDFRKEFLALAQQSSCGQDISNQNSTIDPFLTTRFPGPTNDRTDLGTLPTFSYLESPAFRKPAAPCDYCRSRHLECYMVSAGSAATVGCTPCRSLFRTCSLTRSAPGQRASNRHLDTLHMVPEDGVQHQGGLTGTKPLMSTGASFYDVLDDLTLRRPDKAVTRFSRSTRQIMKDWLLAHGDHPYPTEEEKDALKEQTGLTRSQVSNWLANARRRSKTRSRRGESPPSDFMPGSQPIPITQREEPDQRYMTPLERWKESPPENEPAPFTAIAQAVENSDLPEHESGGSSRAPSLASIRSSSGSNLSRLRAQSSTSLDTGRSSGSRGSFGSGKQSHGSRSSYGSFARKEHRRRRRTVPLATRPPAATNQKARRFHCTFCTDTFNTKYDWTRHEKSLHLSLERWTCCPEGPIVKSPNGTFDICAYCRHSNPSAEHLATHNHTACEEKGLSARTFYRKDHLRQHLRLVHSVSMHANMESWKSTLDVIRSRCGFCPPDKPTKFECWSARAEHLSKHFHAGCTMADWKGEQGFDQEVIDMVSHGMPPYMIAVEARTPLPFSATHQTTWSSTWDEPTRNLGKWVRERQAQGYTTTDDELKCQARLLVFGDPDEWNSSRADHPEWLAAFKRVYGLEVAGADDTGQDQPMVDPSLLDDSFANHHVHSGAHCESSDPTLLPSNNYNSDLDLPQPSCWQLEAMELCAFVNARKAVGQMNITDKELQDHARNLMYGTTEEWDTTLADHPQWLETFRANHGLQNPGQAEAVQAHGSSSLLTPPVQSTTLEELSMSFPDDDSANAFAGGQSLLPTGFPDDLDGFWDPNLNLDLDEGMVDLNLQGS